jgi:membrane dipeptidase
MGGGHSNHSRRQFLAAAAGLGAAALLTREQLLAAEVDPRIAQIISGTITVDMHNHVAVPYTRNPATAKPDPELDLAREMKRSGFSAICETFSPDDLYTTEVGEMNKYVLHGLEYEDRLLARNHMRRALNMKDLQTAHEQGQPIIIQALEGAMFIEGHLERLEVAYERGLRIVQPVHSVDDLVAPLADVYTQPGHLGGLTNVGMEFIKECNRLRIVVDMTHATFEAVEAALEVSTQPMLYSHTGMSRTSATRPGIQMRKEEARMIAEAGGVLGVWWRAATTVREYVGAIKELVDVAGVDHVGIGTDSVLPQPNQIFNLPSTNDIWEDQHGGFFYVIAGEMLKQDFTPEEISKIGGANFCRVFAAVTMGHA